MFACSFRCLILRINGDLSLLDLDDGRERELTHSVELFWVTCGQLGEKTNLIEEVSWLDYGHRGMQVLVSAGIMPLYKDYAFYLIFLMLIFLEAHLQVWYPSLGADPFKQEDFLQVIVASSFLGT